MSQDPHQYRRVVAHEKSRAFAGLPAGPPAVLGLAAATLTVGVEVMVRLAGGARTAAALNRLADAADRRQLESFRP